MKIVIDARILKLEMGGIARYTRELIKHLLELQTDDEFHLIIKKEDQDAFHIQDRRVHLHVTEALHYSLKEQLKLPRLLKKIAPDIVHFTNFNQPLVNGYRSITTIHDLILKKSSESNKERSLLKQIALHLVMKKAIRSHAIIAPSHGAKEDIINLLQGQRDKIHVIYESASSDFYPRSEKDKQAFKKQIGIDKPYILFANQWRPHKGILELIEAFEKLKVYSKLPHKLIILGKPHPKFPEVLERIKGSSCIKDIILPGFVHEDLLPLYYSAADVVAFPSHIEGFGLGLVEAMKTGVPIVIAEAEVPKEITSGAAYVTACQHAEALKQGLITVITDKNLQKNLIQQGFKRSQDFCWKKMAKDTYEIYRKTVHL